jgi:hypothetical protein
VSADETVELPVVMNAVIGLSCDVSIVKLSIRSFFDEAGDDYQVVFFGETFEVLDR